MLNFLKYASLQIHMIKGKENSKDK